MTLDEPEWAAEARSLHVKGSTLKAIGKIFGVSQRQVRNLLVPGEREKHREQARLYRAHHRKTNPLPKPVKPPPKRPSPIKKPAWITSDIEPRWRQEYRQAGEHAAASLARRMLAEMRSGSVT